ncbi:hypothetical protein M9Y10_032936 [Tritrichomonas musculus]|uniref:Tubulin beta chain n=1 Tax=Tritrichomonas musculus TaxID=1915356 RepID=A0ABR2GY80_9EUKA
MVREIIQIQVGECGNRVGARFWERLRYESCINYNNEHEHDTSNSSIPQVYFRETEEQKMYPRSIMIGYNHNQIDDVLTGENPKIYEYNYLYPYESHNSTWSRGNILNGNLHGTKIFEYIRKEVEACNSLQGFQICHSMAGGTGSGLSSYIINQIKDEYPDRVIMSHSIFPSFLIDDFVCQPYNFVLSMPTMINSVDEVICFDNEAITKTCTNYDKISNLSYGDLNFHISQVMSNSTCCFRFTGQFNSDLYKSINNHVFVKNLHFLISRNTPILSRGSTGGYHPDYSFKKFASDLFNNDFLLADCNPQYGSYFAASAIFRGYKTPNEIEEEMLKLNNCNIPKLLVSTFDHLFERKKATMIENTTAIKNVFKRIGYNFQKLFSKNAFINWYTNDGLEKSQFEDSFESLKNLIDEYESYEK